MGNVTFNYDHPQRWMCRAYVKGFTVQVGVTNLHISTKLVTFDYVPAAAHWSLQISDEFWPATSNMYTLDHVFDEAHCFSTVGGITTPTFLNFGIMYCPGENSLRLGTLPGSPGDFNQRVDLPAVSGYWLPI